ncbi:MAG: hypothetical protein IPQ04_11760 [Saprospiraceae bacterium]|nr:hypothetical protein [Saprospiraceae bacterium]
MEQFGIENLTKVVEFGAKLGEGVADILQDGKVEDAEQVITYPLWSDGIPANKDKIKELKRFIGCRRAKKFG